MRAAARKLVEDQPRPRGTADRAIQDRGNGAVQPAPQQRFCRGKIALARCQEYPGLRAFDVRQTLVEVIEAEAGAIPGTRFNEPTILAASARQNSTLAVALSASFWKTRDASVPRVSVAN
jgi:hypothetical protein